MKACEKATFLKEKATISKLTLLEKISMRLHFIMCKPCKKYADDSDQINTFLKNHPQDKEYPEEYKQEIKEKVAD